MSPAMMTPTRTQPILVEIGPEAWDAQLNATEQWLGNVLLTQAAFKRLAEDTVGKIREPHIRDAVATIALRAAEHERQGEELYRVIGRDPAVGRKFAGGAMTKFGQVVADVQGALGGAAGAWRDIHRLLLAGVNALGAFAMAEQLGLALGLPEIVDIALPVVHEKQTHQLVLQEYMLETGPISILYKALV